MNDKRLIAPDCSLEELYEFEREFERVIAEGDEIPENEFVSDGDRAYVMNKQKILEQKLSEVHQAIEQRK